MKTTNPILSPRLDRTSDATLDRETFEQLFELLYSPLSHYAATYVPCRHACEDVVQAAFVSLWEHRATVRVSSALRVWLFTAVRNGCLNHLKKEGHKSEYGNALLREERLLQDEGDAPLASELFSRLDGVLDRLPETYRSVFERHTLDRERLESIAERLGLSVRTVKRYKAAALKVLKRDLSDLLTPKDKQLSGRRNN